MSSHATCPPQSVAPSVCPSQSMTRSWALVVAFLGAVDIGIPPTAPLDVVLESTFADDLLLCDLQGSTSFQLEEAVQPV